MGWLNSFWMGVVPGAVVAVAVDHPALAVLAAAVRGSLAARLCGSHSSWFQAQLLPSLLGQRVSAVLLVLREPLGKTGLRAATQKSPGSAHPHLSA